MDMLTLRPKRDRRTQPRVSLTDIANRAYELYQRRGGDHGHDVDDWLQAERELRTELLMEPANGPHPRPASGDPRSKERCEETS